MAITKAAAQVLAQFLDSPGADQYGFGLMRATGLASGTLYPMLERFQTLGWIQSHLEAIDESAEGRPRRRLYCLTALGQREADRALKDFFRDLPAGRWQPRLGET